MDTTSSNKTIVDQEARSRADMAHAELLEAQSRVKILRKEIKAIRLADRKRKVKERRTTKSDRD